MSALDEVAGAIAHAQQAPTTQDLVTALQERYSEAEVLEALEHWHREVYAEEGIDGRWSWLGPPVEPR